jgi:hypothetical protein
VNAHAVDIADLLRPHVRSFVSMSGGGKYSFQLLCSVPWCYRNDTVSASRRTVGSDTHRMKASRKFAAQGWFVIENAPVCPDCRKAQDT